MTWTTTNDAATFLQVAGPHLTSDRMAHDPLLTEADHWAALDPPRDGGLFGWWAEGGSITSAFVLLPDHALLCSRLTGEQAVALAALSPGTTTWGIDGRDADATQDALRAAGHDVRRAAERRVLRLEGALHPRPTPPGHARSADHSDLPLLHDWFGQFRARHPEDTSDPEFVVDRPLADGGVTLWEVDEAPVAMASRTPFLAGATRMGLTFQPAAGHEHADAAFDAAVAQAATRGDVLVLSGSAEQAATYESLGFVVRAQRVLLDVRPSVGRT